MPTAGKQRTRATTKTRTAPDEVQVHANWLHLIQYCGTTQQSGFIGLKIEAGIPVRRMPVGTKRDIRFEDPLPPLFVRDSGETVTCRLTARWGNFIDFIKTRVPYGQVCISLAGGEPNKLVEKYSAHDINFGHPESFPEVFYIFNEYQQQS